MSSLTVAMTPSFFFEGDWLLKAQLKTLSEQKNKDFDVFLIDSHYSKRINLIPEYAEKYNLNLIHIPYKPNLNVAKRLDCAIFNAPYLYSESKRIVRLSCWRFVRPDFTDICINSPTCVDFYFHNCEPKNQSDAHPETGHSMSIWNFGSDEVFWDQIPKCGELGCSWSNHSEVDAPAEPMPLNCFGNYMIFRDVWLELNGCNEVFTNNEHWEDQDFCMRARNLGVTCSRKSNKMYRLHHWYGNHSGRSNALPDWSFKQPCEACNVSQLVGKPNRYDIPNRLAKGEIELFENEKIWVCKTCHLASAAWSQDEGEATQNILKKKFIKSTILPKYKLGRNLNILADDMNGKSLSEKIEIYNDSWDNEKYYVK